MSSFQRRDARARMLPPRKAERLRLFLVLLPFLIFILAFSYVPLLGWAIAFVDYVPGLPLWKQAFTGIQSFTLAFSGGNAMMLALRNTLVLSGLGLLTSPVPIVFAILLTELPGKRFSKTVQVFSTMPNFFSWVIVYSIFFAVFSTQDGVLNVILMRMHLVKEPTNLLIDSRHAWLFQTCVVLFKNTGYSAIIYIAAMAGIDRELYDAAAVDGAGRLGRILHITVPGLLPTYFVLLLLSVGSLLSAGGFDQYYVFSNPFVINKLEVLDTYTYKIGIQQNNYSLATAIGMLKSLVSIVLVLATNWLSRVARGTAII